MGFIAKFWDETLAGPAPAESDVGKLRRYDSAPATARPGDVIVSRSITVVRTNSGPPPPPSLSVDPALDSPSGSGSTTPRTPTTPGTPMTPPSGDFKKFTRRKLPGRGSERAEPRNPTVYDWIVISALDR